MLVELFPFLFTQPFHESFDDYLEISFGPLGIISAVHFAAVFRDILFCEFREILAVEKLADRAEGVDVFALSYIGDAFRAELMNERKNEPFVFWCDL